jgi:hypothetical protein
MAYLTEMSSITGRGLSKKYGWTNFLLEKFTHMQSRISKKTMSKSSMTTSRKTLKKVPSPGKSPTVRELDAWILKIGGRVITPSQKKKIFKEVRWAKIPGEPAPV